MAHINDSISGLPNKEINVFNNAGLYYWSHVETFINGSNRINGIGEKTVNQCKKILSDINR